MHEEHGNDLHAERGDHYAPKPARGGVGKGIATVLFGVVVVVGGLGAAGYWFYNQGQPVQNEGDLPILLPDPTPIKLRPEDPGGMEVPHRDTTVYEQLDNTDPDTNVVLQELPDMPRAPDVTEIPEVKAPKKSGETSGVSGEEAPEAEATASDTDAVARIEAPEIAETETLSDAQKAVAAAKQKQAASTPAPATKTASSAAGGDFRIQLVSVRDEAAAASEWKRLSSKNKDLLGNLEMHVLRADLGDKGVFYRLQAGPLANEAAAEKLCGDLKQRNVGCLIVRP